jgi:hypothetical protein
MIRHDCPKCGSANDWPDNAAGEHRECPYCGNVSRVPTTESPPPQRVEARPTGWGAGQQAQHVHLTYGMPEGYGKKLVGIFSLVLGIAAFTIGWIPFAGCIAVPFALIAIILGIVGLLARKSGKILPGLGLTFGMLVLLIQLFWVGIFASSAAKSGSSSGNQPVSQPATPAPATPAQPSE